MRLSFKVCAPELVDQLSNAQPFKFKDSAPEPVDQPQQIFSIKRDNKANIQSLTKCLSFYIESIDIE